MSSYLHKKLQTIRQQINDAQRQNTELKKAHRKNQQLLEQMQTQDSLYSSLSSILKHANHIESFSASKLLWGDDCSPEQARGHIQHITAVLQDHKKRHEQIFQQRNLQQQELDLLESHIATLFEQQLELQNKLEEKQSEFIIERKISRHFTGIDTLPWSDQPGDLIRLRMVMLITLCLATLAGYFIPGWQLPPQDRSKYVKIPERMAKLILKKALPPPPKPAAEKKPEEKIKEPEKAKDKPATDKEKIKVARKLAEKTGLLAFKNDFADIIDASSGMKMGSQAVILNTSAAQTSSSQNGDSDSYSGGRSLVTSQFTLSAGATNTASVNRKKISADNNLKKVVFSHVESKIGKTKSSAQQSKQDSVKPTRSDEEIQVVFDRYKEALYHIYNRELRKKPLLKGQLVLRLTIEASGKVSKCIIDSSDLNAPALEKKIVARVLKFNFGKKPGVSTLTILYPIDFLPA